jgi:hypothetical protein
MDATLNFVYKYIQPCFWKEENIFSSFAKSQYFDMYNEKIKMSECSSLGKHLFSNR